MGNKVGALRPTKPSVAHSMKHDTLQDNLVQDSFRNVEKVYSLSERSIGTGSKTVIRQGTSRTSLSSSKSSTPSLNTAAIDTSTSSHSSRENWSSRRSIQDSNERDGTDSDTLTRSSMASSSSSRSSSTVDNNSSLSSDAYAIEDDSDVAIKVYSKRTNLRRDIVKEAKLLQMCDHPNIVKIYEMGRVRSKVSLVMELCTGGTLRERMSVGNEAKAQCIIRQLTSAVAYLHTKRIVHRDIHMDNILFESKQDDSDIKLIDFGFATQLELVAGRPGAFRFLKDKPVPNYAIAPEVIQGHYGPKCDVWSIGVLAYILLTGEEPFKPDELADLRSKILRGFISFKGWKFSDEAKNFIIFCTMNNAGQRMSAAAALRHPWLKSEECLAQSPTARSMLPNEIVASFELYMMMPLLKRVALNALARKAHAARYRQLFRDLDTTESGTLTLSEFMTGFRNSGMSDDELRDLFEALDVNQNGEILYTEFIAATLEAEGQLSDCHLREVFDQIDDNNTGYITKKALIKLLGGTPQINDTIRVLLDGHENLSFAEFEGLFQLDSDSRGSIGTIAETSLGEEEFTPTE